MIHLLLLAYNEEGGIGQCLSRLQEVLGPAGVPLRYVVVDDGSKDRTAEIVRNAAKMLPVTLLQHPKNLGVARGFDTGLRHIAKEASPNDVIVTLEGDNTNDPSFLLKMLEELRAGYDVVCASRYRKGGKFVGFPLKRRIFSFGANWSMRILFPVGGVRDFTIFFRAYRAQAVVDAIRRFGSCFIECSGFTANAEILYKVDAAASGRLRCSEVPLVYRYDLKKGGSKMKVGSNFREYGKLYSSLTFTPAGIGLRQSAALMAFAVFTGLIGIGWGLPEWGRIEEAVPPAMAHDPAFQRKLAESRDALYQKMELNGRLPVDLIAKAEEYPPGWTEVPERFLNSYRSYFLRSENADEQKNLTYLAHMRPRQLKFDPYAASYGGAFLYPLGAWLGGVSALHLVGLTSGVAAYIREPARMAAIFRWGRLFNVLAFAVSAAVLASLGRCLAGPLAGWLAGGIFLMLPVTAIVSHTINPYGWATLWALVMFRFLFRYLDRGEEPDLLKAAAGFGVCFGSSIAFWALSLAMPAAAVVRCWKGSGCKQEFLSLCKAAALSFAVFALMNPYLLLSYKSYRGEMEYELYAFPVVLSMKRVWEFWRTFLGFNMGLIASGLAMAASLRLLLRRSAPAAARIAAGMFVLGFFQLAVRIADPQHGRHFLPFAALGCLVAGISLAQAPRSWKALGVILALAIFGENVPVWASYLWIMSRESRGISTRAEAGQWINTHLPLGASVGLVAPAQPADTPPFLFNRYAVTLFADPRQLEGRPLPRYVVISELRRSPELDRFFEERYRVLARFDPPRLFPWVPIHGLYAAAGARMDVLELRQ